jgi:hypothetical protein
MKYLPLALTLLLASCGAAATPRQCAILSVDPVVNVCGLEFTFTSSFGYLTPTGGIDLDSAIYTLNGVQTSSGKAPTGTVTRLFAGCDKLLFGTVKSNVVKNCTITLMGERLVEGHTQ